MDDVEAAVLTWASNQASTINLAAATAILQQSERSNNARWPYRPPTQPFGPLHRQINAWKDEAEGGLNEYAFTRFTRFTKAHVVELAYKLNLPTEYCWDPSTRSFKAEVIGPEEALLVLLWRMAHPGTLETMIPWFGRSTTWLSRVYNGVLDYIYEQWSDRITMDKKVLLTKDLVEQYCSTIRGSLGTESAKIFGFIDGTDINICRPGELDQRLFYSGNHASHTITHLAIMLPNGLFGAVFDAVPGAGGDAYACIEVGLGQKLVELNNEFGYGAAERRHIYGDAAFGSQDCVLGPYKRSNGELGELDRAVNTWLSTKRVVVEHGFGLLKNQFKFCNLRTEWKASLQPIGKYIPVFSFLINCRTCLRGGNQISAYFELNPPSIDEYLVLETGDDGHGVE